MDFECWFAVSQIPKYLFETVGEIMVLFTVVMVGQSVEKTMHFVFLHLKLN